ncbi:hypothetical protein HGRIS_002469 [Hohenbuehelia grisea]|uniref:Aldehyde dehydrogenase n=1 Tax=Hohenbuehelia grisea TaxID=104357 RepID=A0ABR3JL94_9AGAR
MSYTPINEISKIRDELRATFCKGTTRPLSWRRRQLHQVARMVQENLEPFAKTIINDLGRPRNETYPVELGLVVTRSITSAEKLEEWTKPEVLTEAVPDWQKTWKPTIFKQAKGTVCIIGPWNYPMILTLQPLIGAIAAGCCAIIKPSEFSPAYSTLLAELLPKYLDTSAYRVVLGGIPETTRVLELQWDHIFYTGNGRVGRIVAAAAAKHLTPLTLELGGKSPIIIDANYDMDLAAKRLLWGKISNAGQICISPDHAFIVREKQDEFTAALKKWYGIFYANGPLNSEYGHIVNETHHTRLMALINETKGEIVVGGGSNDKLGIEPTVVKNVKNDDVLMDDELFGPIFPVIPVDSVDDAIEAINARPHPLMLYVFTEDDQVKQKVLENTQSGNIAFGDTFQALSVDALPFGGVGESGYGRQVLKYTFDEFIYLRSSIDMPKEAEPTLEARYPPYNEEKLKFLGAACLTKIPDDA